MFFKTTLEDRVEKAKKNDNELNKLIDEYKPFIASTVQKRAGRYVRYGFDDELTIGMMAFKEAIDAYDKDKGKFLSFAKRVISLRVIDYYRKHKKEKNEVYIGAVNNDDDNIYEIGTAKAITKHQDQERSELRKLEIIQYKEELQKWGIDFSQLVETSPKQKKVRDFYKEVIQTIMEDKTLLDALISKKRLPIKEIQEKLSVHRKKLERGRIYIIALVIVLIGDYDYIRTYIDWR